MDDLIERRKPNIDFRLQRMEDIFDMAGGADDILHRHDYFTVLLIEKAIGFHLIDFRDYPFSGSEVHFVGPGQVHRVVLDSRPRGWAITFTRDFLASNNISEDFISNVNLFQTFKESPPLLLDADDFSRLQSTILEMEKGQAIGLKYRSKALGALLLLFLIYCNNSKGMHARLIGDDSQEVCLLRDFKILVEDRFRSWHKVKEYAAELRVSPKHLSQTVREVTGHVAKEYITDRLVLEAKRLLLHTDSSIKEIAYDLGFNEPLHLSAFFKKYVGCSPTAFRKSKVHKS